MSEERDDLVRRYLDRLEREETKLLSWGVVDGGFTSEEIAEHAEAILDSSTLDISADELRDELFDRRLLFCLRAAGADAYRTRMGEAVRLFARLRQLFPGRQWQLAPTLVADFRFDRRSRRYPLRRLAPDHVLENLAGEVRLTPFKRQALEILLRTTEPNPLQLADFQFHALQTHLT